MYQVKCLLGGNFYREVAELCAESMIVGAWTVHNP